MGLVFLFVVAGLTGYVKTVWVWSLINLVSVLMIMHWAGDRKRIVNIISAGLCYAISMVNIITLSERVGSDRVWGIIKNMGLL